MCLCPHNQKATIAFWNSISTYQRLNLNVCKLQAKIMNPLPGTSRSLLVALVGFTVVAVAIAVDTARSSRSHTDNLTSRSRQEHTEEGSPVGGNHPDPHHRDADARRSKVLVRPAAIATWRFGEIAVDAAKDLLEGGATALDALEAGASCLDLALYTCFDGRELRTYE